MTRWPTWLEIQVWATPITLVMTDSAIIPATSSDEQFRVVLRVGRVDDFPQQERADHAEPRREEDQTQQQGEPRAVRHEQPGDPA